MWVKVRQVNRRDTAAGSGSDSVWLMEGETKVFPLGGEEIYVTLSKNTISLPFQIFLEKFTIGHNPGTRKAATYESQVVVKDAVRTLEQGAHISMNEPLVYGGFTFYQASYSLAEGRPPVSIFSVNRDAGRPVKYAGSLLICLGIITMFWLNPQYIAKMVGVEPKKGKRT